MYCVYEYIYVCVCARLYMDVFQEAQSALVVADYSPLQRGVCVYMNTYIMCMNVHIYICIYLYMCVCVCVCRCMCMCFRKLVFPGYSLLQKYVCVYMYVYYVYEYIFEYIYVYVYSTYIYVYT